MSPPGRPKGEYRSAKHGGCLMNVLAIFELASNTPTVVALLQPSRGEDPALQTSIKRVAQEARTVQSSELPT